MALIVVSEKHSSLEIELHLPWKGGRFLPLRSAGRPSALPHTPWLSELKAGNAPEALRPLGRQPPQVSGDRGKTSQLSVCIGRRFCQTHTAS